MADRRGISTLERLKVIQRERERYSERVRERGISTFDFEGHLALWLLVFTP